ncbi:probable G-protein coupled receptor 139 [Heterodontus francisci]|uniref:probable G-protein coupled receptor 139 n=1 Tax=Heterodontus francisci TaxID=7792 RepID=UPI00355B63FE
MDRTIDSILKIYYPFLAVIGVPINLLAIVILSRGKCGLSTCTTHYLVAMATADLLVLIFEVVQNQISYYYFPLSFLNITHVCRVKAVLLSSAIDCSVWFTVTFTFDRFVAICCQKLKTKYCTKKTAAVVLATTCILLCSKNIPHYFAYEPGEIIDNVPWFCSMKPRYYTDPGWVGFDWFDSVLTPLIPFALILLLNALTVRHILVASRVRKGLRGQSKGENHSDPEMESRRKSVILLFSISGSFILLWLVYVLYYLNITYHFNDDFSFIFEQVGYMLQNLSCCTNTFIYMVTQSKFREQVKSAVKVKSHEAEDYMDRMFRKVVTLQVRNMQAEKEWVTARQSKRIRQVVQETPESILLANRFSILDSGKSNGASGECSQCKAYGTTCGSVA